MNRAQVLEHLALSKPTLIARYGVTDLALFGSTVRDTARADSDINILLSFDGKRPSNLPLPPGESDTAACAVGLRPGTEGRCRCVYSLPFKGRVRVGMGVGCEERFPRTTPSPPPPSP